MKLPVEPRTEFLPTAEFGCKMDISVLLLLPLNAQDSIYLAPLPILLLYIPIVGQYLDGCARTMNRFGDL